VKSTRLNESLPHATDNETQSVCLLDRNCSETHGMCHEHATCSLVSPEVCTYERPISYGCVCNQGYAGDGIDCQGQMTLMWPKTRPGPVAENPPSCIFKISKFKCHTVHSSIAKYRGDGLKHCRNMASIFLFSKTTADGH